MWSRRISKKDRLIYSFDDKYIYIIVVTPNF
nr:type II toxin-antitoxin system YoeB family toxin [Sodalinema gerasimenkoae]